MALYVSHRSKAQSDGTAAVTDTSRGPSQEIWKDCPWLEFLEDPNRGYGFHFDFNWSDEATPLAQGWAEVLGTNATSTLSEEIVTGAIELTTGAADDNSEAYYAGNGNLAGLVKVTSGGPEHVWWEMRFRVNSVTTVSYVFGLMNEGEIAADVLADTQTDAAILDTSAPDFIGFITAGDTDADGLDAAYMDQATVGAHIVHQNIAQLMVVNTWYKAGIHFHPQDNAIRYYVDGVQVGADLSPTTAQVPDGEELLPVFGIKNGSAAARLLEVDWVRIAYGL